MPGGNGRETHIEGRSGAFKEITSVTFERTPVTAREMTCYICLMQDSPFV